LRVRLPDVVVTMVDAWREAQPERPSRSVAVRTLLTNHFWPPVIGIAADLETGGEPQ
jgi:hypothetical protein